DSDGGPLYGGASAHRSDQLLHSSSAQDFGAGGATAPFCAPSPELPALCAARGGGHHRAVEFSHFHPRRRDRDVALGGQCCCGKTIRNNATLCAKVKGDF